MPYDKTKNIINTRAKEKMSTRRTRQSRSIKGVDINLTDIKFNSTCISLNIPLMLCCNNCKPKVESTNKICKKSSKGQKRIRDYTTDRWKCQQLWLSTFGEANHTNATVRMHVRVQKKLNILQEAVIEEKKLQERDKLVLINNNDSTATKNDHEGQQATVKCTSALPLSKQIKAREEKVTT